MCNENKQKIAYMRVRMYCIKKLYYFVPRYAPLFIYDLSFS